MTDDLRSLSDDDVRRLLLQSKSMLTSLSHSLSDRPDMLNAVRELMAGKDMLTTFGELVADSPDILRLVLQASIAALVNVHSVHALDAELARRAVHRN